MDTSKVLKQAWQILLHYRILWVFGFVLALTTFSAEAMILSGLDDWETKDAGLILKGEDHKAVIPGPNITVDLSPADGFVIIFRDNGYDRIVVHSADDLRLELHGRLEKGLAELDELFTEEVIPPDVTQLVVGSLAIIAVVVVGVVLLATVGRYVSESAVIHAVGRQAETGKKDGFRKLLRLGFSRTAWRFFLIDLAIRLPLALIFLVLFLLALAPLLLWAAGSAEWLVFGTVVSTGLVFSVMALALFTGLVVSVFTHFIRRACALEDLGVMASIGQGFGIVRHNLRDTVLMAIMMLAVSVGFVLLLIPASIVLIPALIVFSLLAAGAAIAVIFPVAALSGLVLGQVLNWVLAGMLAAFIIVPIIGAPFFFLSGMLQVYKSSAWTLTYGQLRAVETAGVKPTPKVALAGA